MTNNWHPCVATSYAHGAQVAKSIQAELLAAAPAALSRRIDVAPASLLASAG